MIIAAERITTASGPHAVADHVLRGRDNEAIVLLQGVEADLEDMVRDARAHGQQGAKYAIRHYHVDPAEPMSREQMFVALKMTADEFSFDAERVVVVEHHKLRQGGAGYDVHWHWLAPEVDPIRGRTLDAHWMRPRQEKLSRTIEVRLGHASVRGRWSQAVVESLRHEGMDDIADVLVERGLTTGERPRSAYSKSARQSAKRLGMSMPDIKAHVTAAWEQADGYKALSAALRAYETPLELAPGDKPGTWVVYALCPGGPVAFVGALDRLLRLPRAAVAKRMAAVEDLTFELTPDPELPPVPGGANKGEHHHGGTEQAPTMGHRGRPGDPGWQYRPEGGEGDRPQGANANRLRNTVLGDDGGAADRVVGAARPAVGGGDDQGRRHPRLAGAGRRGTGPDGAADGRYRVEARYAQRALTGRVDDGRLARLRDLTVRLDSPVPVVRAVAVSPFDPLEGQSMTSP